jgi:hypothetical protein
MWRNRSRKAGLAVLAVAVLCSARSRATTITIQADMDADVWSAAPNNNLGHSQVSYVGRHLSKNSRFRGFAAFRPVGIARKRDSE